MFNNINTCSLKNGPWVQRKLHKAVATKREASFHRLDCWRGLPNNRPRDPAGILGFHPRVHLNNDADKLSRLMVLLASIREIYDMQANGRKATWFNMQKLVVNDYALGILVLKVTTTPQDSYSDRITESHRD
jgi:hypothetical protein